VKREADRLIEMITGWILTAFSAFVPKNEGCRMGTAFSGRGIEPIQPLLLNNFSPTSENISSFLALPTAYCILPTAFFGDCPEKRIPLVLPEEFLFLPEEL
jgi:hypothetical protein